MRIYSIFISYKHGDHYHGLCLSEKDAQDAIDKDDLSEGYKMPSVKKLKSLSVNDNLYLEFNNGQWMSLALLGESYAYRISKVLWNEILKLVKSRKNPDRIIELLGIESHEVVNSTFESCSFVVALKPSTIVEVCSYPEGITKYRDYSKSNPLWETKKKKL